MFIGQARPERVPLVKRVSAAFRTRVFGTSWNTFEIPNDGMLPADQVVPAVNSATVCVDFARNLAGDYMVKYRMFEFAGCGAVGCTERFTELGFHFTFDPDYRSRIAANAYRRSRAEHTFSHRWHSLLARCGVHLPVPDLISELAATMDAKESYTEKTSSPAP
jgi:hypothetical protein